MTNAKQLAALPLETPRFGVVEGGRKPVVAAQAATASAPQQLMRSNLRHRSLFLVDSSTDANIAHSVPDTFEQTRRIVAQVEQEIQQQLAREGRLRQQRMQPFLATPEATSSMRNKSVLQRLTQFFAL